MNESDFDELAGRIEGLSRAVLALAAMMERETDMDGMTLTRQWRESIGPEAEPAVNRIARRTLHELAQSLDDARSRHQQSVRIWRAQQQRTAQELPLCDGCDQLQP